ncbi:MAG: pyridoxal phosphate-dependent aminotransferase [Bacillota bacterium]
MKYSSRLESLSHSATITISDRVKRMRAEGRDVISMAAARPNFDAPPAVKEATAAAVLGGEYSEYSESRGLLELREAVSQRLSADSGVSYDPETEILITVGQREGLSLALGALVDPGDDVIVPDPGWVTYRCAVAMAGGTPLPFGFEADRGFRPRIEDIGATSTRSRALILNTPANPTGTVFTRDELEEIRDIAVAADLTVLTDEIYAPFVYDGLHHVSPAAIGGMRERTLVTGAVSKAWAMTGWRVGFAAGPAQLIDRMLMLHQHLVSCPCTFAQKGAVVALRECSGAVENMVRSYAARRDILARGLREIGGVDFAVPEGACFLFPRFEGISLDGETLVAEFLERGALALTPGEAFGSAGAGRVRMSFASTPEEMLREVLERIGRVLRQIRE